MHVEKQLQNNEMEFECDVVNYIGWKTDRHTHTHITTYVQVVHCDDLFL